MSLVKRFSHQVHWDCSQEVKGHEKEHVNKEVQDRGLGSWEIRGQTATWLKERLYYIPLSVPELPLWPHLLSAEAEGKQAWHREGS